VSNKHVNGRIEVGWGDLRQENDSGHPTDKGAPDAGNVEERNIAEALERGGKRADGGIGPSSL